MFYSYQLLTKKGPLGRIWLAGTVRSKLTRRHVQESDIVTLTESVLDPPMPLALRLSAVLLLGLCVIYQRKCSYLLVEAHEFLTKVRLPQSGSSVTLSRDKLVKYETITLPDLSKELDIFGALELLTGPIPQEEPEMTVPIRWDQTEIEIAVGGAMVSRFEEDITLPLDLRSSIFPEEEPFAGLEGGLEAFEEPISMGLGLQGDEVGTPMTQMELEMSLYEAEPFESPAVSTAAILTPTAVPPSTRRKRWQRQVDETTEIDSSTIRSWLLDTSAIVTDRNIYKVQKEFSVDNFMSTIYDSDIALELLEMWESCNAFSTPAVVPAAIFGVPIPTFPLTLQAAPAEVGLLSPTATGRLHSPLPFPEEDLGAAFEAPPLESVEEIEQVRAWRDIFFEAREPLEEPTDAFFERFETPSRPSAGGRPSSVMQAEMEAWDFSIDRRTRPSAAISEVVSLDFSLGELEEPVSISTADRKPRVSMTSAIDIVTYNMLKNLRGQMEHQNVEELEFIHLVHGQDRRTAARSFYQLLGTVEAF